MQESLQGEGSNLPGNYGT